MAKAVEGLVKLIIRAGTANPAPPIGPALGAKGVNIMEFCNQFNAQTQNQPGKLLPVVITVYADKSFKFIIKTPPAATQLVEAAKIKKGSGEPNRIKVGTVTWENVEKIAESKIPDLNTAKIHSAMKQVAGTARSMGINISGKPPWGLKEGEENLYDREAEARPTEEVEAEISAGLEAAKADIASKEAAAEEIAQEEAAAEDETQDKPTDEDKKGKEKADDESDSNDSDKK